MLQRFCRTGRPKLAVVSYLLRGGRHVGCLTIEHEVCIYRTVRALVQVPLEHVLTVCVLNSLQVLRTSLLDSIRPPAATSQNLNLCCTVGRWRYSLTIAVPYFIYDTTP